MTVSSRAYTLPAFYAISMSSTANMSEEIDFICNSKDTTSLMGLHCNPNLASAEMCRQIETAIEKCVRALAAQDFALAREVRDDDALINKLERDIEQSCQIGRASCRERV